MNTHAHRKTLQYLSYVLIALFLFAGCEEEAAEDTGPLGEVFGTLFDATTGERLSGIDLELYLIGGGEVIDPDMLDTEDGSLFAGDYVFNDVPIASAVDIYTYKMMSTNKGYQQFEGYFDFASGASDYYISLIKNIYLFPTGASAGDIQIYVERGNERVSGAEVILQQNIGANAVTAETNPYRLVAAPGLMPRLTATTNTDGLASFPGSSLILGGAYTPSVLPTTHDGTRLALATGTQIIVGQADTPLIQLITVADEEPGTNPKALYVVYASNRNRDDITGDGSGAGVLTIVFNRRIEIYREWDYGAFLTRMDTTVRALLDTSAANNTVIGTTSSDGYTLILTPNWARTPKSVVEDRGLLITYYDVQVTLRNDDQWAVYNVFTGLHYLNGIDTVWDTVPIIDPNLK